LNFLDRFSKNIQISNFVKIRPVSTDLFYSGGLMGRHDEADIRLSQFCERDIKNLHFSFAEFLTFLAKRV